MAEYKNEEINNPPGPGEPMRDHICIRKLHVQIRIGGCGVANTSRNKRQERAPFRAVKRTNGLFRAFCKHWPRHISPASPESNSARGNSHPTPSHFAAMAYFFLIYGLISCFPIAHCSSILFAAACSSTSTPRLSMAYVSMSVGTLSSSRRNSSPNCN